jgi:fructose-bisphosphate aldolase/6-deoxy-5-ketofructose 1-phosphate synthase
MSSFAIPLTVPARARREYHKNYQNLTHNTGRLLLIAGDQKVEHLNTDFYGTGIDTADQNPEHLFKIAAASEGGVLATHLGFIARYGQNYRQLPYIVKVNGKTNIGENDLKNSSPAWWNIEEIVNFKKQSGLNIVGVGYTIYLGGRYEAELLATAANLVYQAHQHGLTAIIWMYPRGKNINEENIHTIAGGAGVAGALGADFVKIKYPYRAKNQKLIAKQFNEAIQAAGRTKVICVGGEPKTVKELLDCVEKQITISGTAGLAIGRNLHQKSLAEATNLTRALGAIIFKSQTAKIAEKIYTQPKPKPKSRRRFLGLL